MTRPVVGVTVDFLPARSHVKYTVYDRYVRALDAAGARPIVLPPNPSAVGEQVELVAGILLPGGDDLDPSLWDEAPGPAHVPSDARRTEYELSLVESCLDEDVPLLGVCLGLQVMNVALGGSIVQDVDQERVTHQDTSRDLALRHDIDVVAGSRLATALGVPDGGRVSVNSAHHQAPGRVGEGLVASARAEDGVIEALEHRDHPFAIGVQWHPDADWESDPHSASLFRAFVAACAKRRGGP